MRESFRMQAVQAPIIPVIADLIRQCPGTISLGQGVVRYAPPPEASAQLARFFSNPALHKYQAVGGIPELLAQLEAKLALENGIQIDANNRVMVTAGGNQAFLNAVLAIADPGDEFILPTPYYFNHEMAITMANCRPMLVPTDANYQLDLEAIAAAITPRTRAIITVSPNNPTGAVYPHATLRKVNHLCAARGIYHLSDEAYEYFTYDGVTHFSPASLAGSAAHTISLFSLSKSYGFASWRIGWMVFPAAMETAMRKIQDTVLICPPVISQYGAMGALSAGATYVRQGLADIAEVRAVVQRELTPLTKEGLAIVPPAAGAFYFLLRLQSRRPALEVAERLIRDHGVAVIPGVAFGLHEQTYLRVAYGSLDKATACEGIGRLVRGLRALAQ